MNWFTLLQDVLWSGVAAVGFAILFNVPPKTLIACMICGALGHGTRSLLMEFGISIAPATLAGAAVVGTLSAYFARRLEIPSLVFAICGAIPMVPGSFAYRTMLGVIRLSTAVPDMGEPILVETAINFTNTGLILAAIALGITMPTLLFRRRKPVV
jgi:uncharacterized membrane protein YjjB (DUF3815 family)